MEIGQDPCDQGGPRLRGEIDAKERESGLGLVQLTTP